MTKKEIKPPQWATRFLGWYCRPELLEDLQGDVNEYFERNIKSKGIKKAKLIYIIDVLKFLRFYTIRKPEFIQLLIQWIMIGSYIKTSGRNIVRNKLFSSINIVGLAISMSVGLLLIGLLSDMFEYDRFHTNGDRIYRVISKYKYLHEDESTFGSTSLKASQLLKESVPGIDQVATLYRGFEGDIKSGDKTVPLRGHWANESFFDVFTFQLIKGNPATALTNPFSVVLTEESAIKLFGSDNPLGKIITKQDKEFLVTGVVKDVPMFSHIKFDILASLSSREITQKETMQHEMSWSNIWNGYTYILLNENQDLSLLEKNLATLCAKEDKTVKNTSVKLALQPLHDIALGEDLNNSIGYVMGKDNVWMIGILAAIVLLSACFNYTNLSIARSLRRAREVGIRKVSGALKHHVISQFVVEAVMIALLALGFALVLFTLLKPYFLSLNEVYSNMLTLSLSPKIVVLFILFAIGVGIIAGFFPALFFSRLNTIYILKNNSTERPGKMSVRKGLIVIQFTISLMFIFSTIIGYKYYKQVLTFDLGFKTENIINITLHGNKANLLKKELTEMAEVKKISTSSVISSLGNYYGTRLKYKDPLDSTYVYQNIIDENYIPLMGHELLAGRNFTNQSEEAPETEVIVNEQILKRLNIGEQDPAKAIGETVIMDRKPVTIIGVVKNYMYGRALDQDVHETIFRYSVIKANYINVQITSTDWPATLTNIENAWKKIDDIHPLEARFYEDDLILAYDDFSSRIKIIGMLSFLAICIASIGLIGMVVFTTETRSKEISIRKVLGASEGSLIILLSRGFLILMFIAAVISLPTTQFFFAKYVLAEYSNGAPNAFIELIVGMISVIGIALLLVGSQTLKAARSNPAQVLKSE